MKQRGKNGPSTGSVTKAFRKRVTSPGKMRNFGRSAAKVTRVQFGKGVETVQDKGRSGIRRLPPKSSPGFDERNGEKSWSSWRRWNTVERWPQQARTTMFFLIPNNVTSGRPIAVMPTLIRWWEAVRAPQVAKRQQKYRVDWDATDGRNGGAQRTVWEILLEMERF